MNQTYDLAVPLQKVKVQKITTYKIQQVIVHLFSGCSIAVSLKDENNTLVEDITLEMNPDDYNQWNDNDNYIINWINTQLQEKYNYST